MLSWNPAVPAQLELLQDGGNPAVVGVLGADAARYTATARAEAQKDGLPLPAAGGGGLSGGGGGSGGKDAPATWACPGCTLVNQPAAAKCEVCDTPKPAAAKPAAAKASGWACLLCSLENEGGALKCAVCGNARPPTAGGGGGGGGGWACGVCTLENPAAAAECTACGSAKR